MSTMMLSRRVLLLSALLCGVLCSSSAFTVRSGPEISPLLSSERHHRKCRSLTNRSSDISTEGKGVALSVASGGASSNDGPSRLDKIRAFTSKNFFLMGMMVAVALARAFPHVSRRDTSNIPTPSISHLPYFFQPAEIHTHNVTQSFHPPQIQIIYCNTARKKWRSFSPRTLYWQVWRDLYLSPLGPFTGTIRAFAIDS